MNDIGEFIVCVILASVLSILFTMLATSLSYSDAMTELRANRQCLIDNGLGQWQTDLYGNSKFVLTDVPSNID